jgi:formamidopyrimidine-DNA glycosylase
MPELPEVEAVARALRPLVVGQRIRRCRVIHPTAVRPSSGHGGKAVIRQLESRLQGQRIRAVARFGKYLTLTLDDGCLILRFRLDGQLTWLDSRKMAGHIDVALDLEKGTLGFVDPRHLGRVQWMPSPQSLEGIRTLGIEPLSPEFTASRFAELLKRSRLPLKLFLLDQSKVSGIGNIYSSEALWRARLDPRRRANRLSPSEAKRLHKAIVDVLHRALECCSDSAPDFRDPKWWFQGLDEILRVYGREGKPCRRCGAPIRRVEQGGRSSFVCFGCQK